MFRSAVRHFRLVLEGGSIDTDGQGSLLTTSNCLITNSRNPGCDKAAFERLFAEEMGIQRVFWLDHGELEGDDTDAHIDMLARFCSPQTIAYTQCTNRSDSNYTELYAMGKQLETLTTLEGSPYRLIPLPLPAPIHSATGERLPASYANFLVINGAALVPVYDDPADAIALERLAVAFPDRQSHSGQLSAAHPAVRQPALCDHAAAGRRHLTLPARGSCFSALVVSTRRAGLPANNVSV